MRVNVRTSILLRPILLGALLFAAVLTVGSGSAIGLGNGVPEQFGTAVRRILDRPSDGPTVALVDGTAISQRRLDLEIITRQFSGQPSDPSSALQGLITQQVVLNQAARQGILVSDPELNAFVTTQRDLANQDPERHFYGYAAGLGQTETSIWRYQPLIDAWRQQMVVGKLKRAVLGEVTQQTLAAKEAQWATYVDGLRTTAQVVVR